MLYRNNWVDLSVETKLLAQQIACHNTTRLACFCGFSLHTRLAIGHRLLWWRFCQIYCSPSMTCQHWACWTCQRLRHNGLWNSPLLTRDFFQPDWNCPAIWLPTYLLGWPTSIYLYWILCIFFSTHRVHSAAGRQSSDLFSSCCTPSTCRCWSTVTVFLQATHRFTVFADYLCR